MRKIPVFVKEDSREIAVFDSNGEVSSKIELPPIFMVDIRKDLIRRAYLSEFTARLQPKGRDPMAGKRTSAESLGVGRGIARVPRIKNSIRAALINFAVGGRLAHPPRVDKKIHERINKKERILATLSALSATSVKNVVQARGHIFNVENMPVVIDDNVLDAISKTSEAVDLLKKIGVYDDIERARELTRVRAGKGKRRGRRYKEPKSILFVLPSINNGFAKSVRNLPGVDVVNATLVSVLHLAPGGEPGRLAVYTPSSINLLVKRFDSKIKLISI